MRNKGTCLPSRNMKNRVEGLVMSLPFYVVLAFEPCKVYILKKKKHTLKLNQNVTNKPKLISN